VGQGDQNGKTPLFFKVHGAEICGTRHLFTAFLFFRYKVGYISSKSFSRVSISWPCRWVLSAFKLVSLYRTYTRRSVFHRWV